MHNVYIIYDAYQADFGNRSTAGKPEPGDHGDHEEERREEDPEKKEKPKETKKDKGQQ